METEVFRSERVGLHSMFDISFSLFQGEFLMVMGLRGNCLNELADILAGCTAGYTGSLYLNGRKTVFTSVQDANQQGVYIIRSSSAIIGNFRLSENTFLVPQYVKAPFFLQSPELDCAADKLFKQLGLHLRGSAYGSQCDIFEQHAVITARAVSQGARVILFENVMNSYTDDQISRFRSLIRTLRTCGVSVILFSGIITDVYEQADRILILRDATIAHIFEKGAVDKGALFQALTQDKRTTPPVRHDDGAEQEALVHLTEFSPDGYTGPPLNLSIKRSCVTSLITEDISSASLLLESLFGEIPFHGTFTLNGAPCRFSNCSDAIAAGIGIVKEELEDNLFWNFPAETNISLMIRKYTAFSSKAENRRVNRYLARKTAEKYEIDSKLLWASNVGTLSNISRLKLTLLRWLVLNLKLLLLIHPYCNLDEMERLELSKTISRIASKGVGILMVSTMMSDVVNISHEIIRI